jgi:hypothetical protein
MQEGLSSEATFALLVKKCLVFTESEGYLRVHKSLLRILTRGNLFHTIPILSSHLAQVYQVIIFPWY